MAFAAQVKIGVKLAVGRGCDSTLPPPGTGAAFAFALQHCLGWSPGLHNTGAEGVSDGDSVIWGH